MYFFIYEHFMKSAGEIVKISYVIFFSPSQEAFKHNNSWLPPSWAIVTIAILGFNEFMMLLR